MRHHFEAEQWLPYPVELVFSFFGNPENLPPLMPTWQHARIEQASLAPAPPRPEGQPRRAAPVAGAGTTMTISFRPFPFAPVRIPWDAEITDFAWNDHFCDSQTRGPFAYWHHCHHVSAVTREGKEGTLLRDVVDYELPLGFLGELGQRTIVPMQFRSMFNYRHKQTAILLARVAVHLAKLGSPLA